MGVQIKDLITANEISIDDLQKKILVFDTSNVLYQFLTSIRARDGSLLQDSHGNVTSHLQGLLLRVSNFLDKGIKPCFVLDGEFPKLKKEETERRKGLKLEANKKYKIAEKRGDIEQMKKYAARTVVLTGELVEEATKLISAFGLPVIQAPSEAEAQAAFIVKKGDAYAAVSQDFDSLLHGTPKLVRNLSIAGKRKKASKLSYSVVKPEIIDLAENLNNLGIDNNQLIALAMLLGTDYNIGGIKGIGPVNALKLVKEHGTDFGKLFKDVNWDNYFDFEWLEVYYLIKKMPVKEKYELEWKPINKEKIIGLLCDEHDFSEERVSKVIEKLVKEKKKQVGLDKFFR